MTSGDHPGERITKIGQNTEKGQGDLRILAALQTPVTNNIKITGKITYICHFQRSRFFSCYYYAQFLNTSDGFNIIFLWRKDEFTSLGWLIGSVLWHISLCRLFNAKSILKQIISSISNNSVEQEYTV